MGEPPAGTFFAVPGTRDVADRPLDWFNPTDLARGPWDPDACHAGPPTALLARALERALPAKHLVRISVVLTKPVPMSGFAVAACVGRDGRSVATSTAELIDGDGVVRASATGLHIAARDEPLFDRSLDNSGVDWPRLADAVDGTFPIGTPRHSQRGFRDAIATRYPPGDAGDIGSTTLWMRAVAILPDEEPSPFQRICPLADCGNAFSRHRNPDAMGFVNADLTIALHRRPVGEWLGMRSVSQWQPTGIGVATSSLFDDQGTVGTALQTLVLTPARAL